DGPTDVGDVDVEVLRHKPEAHCAGRYEVVWDGGAVPRVFTLFGKTYVGDRAGEIHRQIEAVWRKSLDEPRSFLIAGALGYARSVRTVWQASLVGLPLLPVISTGGCDDVLRAVGTALAILHETQPVRTLAVGVGDQLAEMQAQVGALVEAFPEAKGALEPIAARLCEEGPALTPVPASLVHGDFI